MSKYNRVYCFADIAVEAEFNYEYLLNQCFEYLSSKEPLFTVSVNKEDIEEERTNSENNGYIDGYLESIAFYRKFCEKAARYGVILFHSSAVSVDGKAYLFAAPSGVGKSTHTSLWRKVFGKRAVMINDDKPLIRVENEADIYVYGTPWDGKHGLSSNIKAEVAGICYLQRGKENRILRVNKKEGLPLLLSQTFRPREKADYKSVLNAVTTLAGSVPLWRMECCVSEEAAVIAYTNMSEGYKKA